MKNFLVALASMPNPIRDAACGIIMSWIPLSDESDDYEYSELATAFRDNQNSFSQTRRGQQ